MANDSLDFVQRGRICIVRRQYAEAVKICRLGLLGQPSLLEGRLVLGMALSALRRWDEVLGEMRVALETSPESALAWLLKGEALMGKGDYAQADASLRRARELDPSNAKADQLLAEIAQARAAGFEGLPVEPTDTKVYPARASTGFDADFDDEAMRPMPGGRGELVPLDEPAPEDEDGDEVAVEYEDDATRIDPPATAAAPATFAADEDTVDDSQVDTEAYARDAGYDEPATPAPPGLYDHHAPDARRALLEDDEDAATLSVEGRSPLAEPRAPEPAAPARLDGSRPSTSPAAQGRLDASAPAIPLHTIDLVLDRRYTDGEPARAAEAPPGRFGDAAYDDERTRERERQERAARAGASLYSQEEPGGLYSGDAMPRPTVPARPNAGLGARATWPAPSPRPSRSANLPGVAGVAARLPPNASTPRTAVPPPEAWAAGDDAPGVVRVPVKRRPPPPSGPSLFGLLLEHPRRGAALLATALVAVIGVGVVSGLLVREWRMRVRVAKRHELARQKLTAGNYPGFQAAELLYKQILAERDDPEARALRARVLGQQAFEFGDAPDPATRAVLGLGEPDDAVPCADDRPGCRAAAEARVYLALALGQPERALTAAQALRRRLPDAAAAYLVGRAELLLERPAPALESLAAAVAAEPRQPLYLHGFGLAAAAAHDEARALAAYERALALNPNHIATLIDRALVRPRDEARAALARVVGRLVNEASQGQLARAWLGLAELDRREGDIAAARRDLSLAATNRREGDALFSEALAQGFARVYMLDEAEREARRAIATAGRAGARLVLAEVALKRGRPAETLAVLEPVTSPRAEVHLLRALAALDLGRRQSARIDAEAARAQAPELVAAQVALARCDLADGRLASAERALNQVARKANGSEVATALGLVELARHQPQAARAHFAEAARRDPFNLEALLALARLDHDANRLDEARTRLKELLAINAGYLPARRALADVDLDAGDAEAARDELDALLTPCAGALDCNEQPDLGTLLAAARAHILVGDGAGARERIARAQKLSPPVTMAEELADLEARALLADHRPADAAALVKPLVPRAAHAETPALAMAAWLDLDKPERAAEVPAAAPPAVRGGVELLLARARLAVERGSPAGESLANDALARLKGARGARALRSEAYYLLGRAAGDNAPAQAMRALRSALGLWPQNARAWFLSSRLAEAEGKPTEALAAMEQAAKYDRRSSDALYYLGRLRAAAHDPSAAEAYRRYLEIDPKGIYADEVGRALAALPTATPTNSAPRRPPPAR